MNKGSNSDSNRRERGTALEKLAEEKLRSLRHRIVDDDRLDELPKEGFLWTPIFGTPLVECRDYFLFHNMSWFFESAIGAWQIVRDDSTIQFMAFVGFTPVGVYRFRWKQTVALGPESLDGRSHIPMSAEVRGVAAEVMLPMYQFLQATVVGGEEYRRQFGNIGWTPPIQTTLNIETLQ